MPKSVSKCVLLLLLPCLLLAGCGNKGPLVRPESEPAEAPVESGAGN
jgi:predicted small lipoprotein YifL